VPALATSFAEIRTALALRPANAKPDNSVLQVEFIDNWGRPRLLSDFHQSVELRHLAWVGKKTMEGATFSQPQMCEIGVLSQQQFWRVKAEFLRLRYAVNKNDKAPRLGAFLTERGKRLVKKALEAHGDDFS
jgi:hypothetical protein